jgi:hypothetical protein
VDINRAWETVRENIYISAKESLRYCELKKHNPWFNEGCSELVDQRKQATMQWLQDPSKINGGNLNSIRRETSGHFRNKKREYLKDKIYDLAMNSEKKKKKNKDKDKDIRDPYRGKITLRGVTNHELT